MAVPNPEQSTANPGLLKGRSLVEIAWNRISLVLLGIVIGLTLGTLYYVQATPVYQSKAQVLVIKKRPDNVTGIDTRNLTIEDYVATHKQLIESPLIIDRAMKARNLAALESLAHRDDLTEFIKKSLSVSRNRSGGATNSNVLDLSFRGIHAEECRTVLDAIIESYKSDLDETYRVISDDTVELVKKARESLEKKLEEQKTAYFEFRKKAPLLALRVKGGANLTQERLGSIEAKRSSLLVRKSEILGYLKTIDHTLKNGGNRDALLSMVTEWTGRLEGENSRPWEKLTLQNQLYPLLQEEQKLLDSKGEKHPEVVAIRKRIEVARAFLGNPAAPWQKGRENGVAYAAETTPDPINAARSYFHQHLTHIDVSEKLLADLLQEEFDAAKAIANYEVEDDTHRMAMESTVKLVDGLKKRLEDVNFVKNIGGYDAKVIAPPTLGKKVLPSGMMVFPIALLFGSLAGLGLAYLAETTDKSFRSVDEVRQRLGLPVVGQIPCLPASEREDAGQLLLDPILHTHHRPKSVEAESYRGVRTALYFNIHGKGHKVVQVTSPNVGDGKSTLAANLAISIAQSGKKVLLIDADMRKPTIHKLFGVSSALGLSSVIVEEVEPKEAIQTSGIAGLSILASGMIPPNPSELLTAPRFEELLKFLRDEYDFIVVDTPPLLAVTDPSVVAHKVDAVLLNVRFAKNARPDAERAREVLHNLKANVIGVVVNDADQLLHTSGYGYGYGYGSPYHDPAVVPEQAKQLEYK